MATGDKKRAVMTTDIDNGSSTYPVLSPSGDGSNVTAAFTAASTRTNISTGEKLGILFGKIAKWFTDLGAAAFRGVDAAPTANSTNLVESGGVKSAIDKLNEAIITDMAYKDYPGGQLDISVRNQMLGAPYSLGGLLFVTYYSTQKTDMYYVAVNSSAPTRMTPLINTSGNTATINWDYYGGKLTVYTAGNYVGAELYHSAYL